MSESPIILLGFHRGGTTFVQRCLNCYEGLTVWGEHAGFLHEIRVAFEKLESSPLKKISKNNFSDFSGYEQRWIPWVSPFDAEDFLACNRDLIVRLYKHNGRWGFKEIRYGCLESIRFIFRLFPDAKILFLHRNPRDTFVSSALVKWTRIDTSSEMAIRSESAAFIREYFQRLRAAQKMQDIAERFGVISYEKLIADCDWLPAVSDFLELPQEAMSFEKLSYVRSSNIGSSYADVASAEATESKAETIRRVFDEE